MPLRWFKEMSKKITEEEKIKSSNKNMKKTVVSSLKVWSSSGPLTGG